MMVVRQTTGTSSIDFVYDSQQRPYAMRYNNVWYYYLLNLQGDVVKIIDGSGNARYGSISIGNLLEDRLADLWVTAAMDQEGSA